MSRTAEPPTNDVLNAIPAPGEIHRRLTEIAREQTILRRLLQLSLRAREERERRANVNRNAAG